MRDIAIYNDQVKLARSSPDRPKRSCFSKDARRFVLRADHFCKLGKSWIGLKNYRYFLLTCFYCFIFSVSIVLSRLWLYTGIYRYYTAVKNNSKNTLSMNYTKDNQIINDLKEKVLYSNSYRKKEFDDTKKFKFRFWYAFGIVTTLIACFFGFSSLFTFYRNFYNLYRNVTEFELLAKKHVEKWDRGCIKNFEEVCGSKKYLLFWPFPFICLEPMEKGFYDEVWDSYQNNFDSESQISKLHTIDSIY